ncbi:DUF1178 family protein [Rhodobacter calidifons]|uniref:DUF1178 family protein n=1 Tax=Rhodobacter calidifons TaxID=2715277 RepID=A0ABX0G2I1_9RHOB|nr:DUF1178 family protein [Rhodobacter calidifons]NHB75207.1 DUF1178 family protein [Rhodobacter calidifons]
MIRYSLRCRNDHGFDSWFKGADAFAALQAAGQIACPVCGSTEVRKDLMAPAVRPARKAHGAGLREGDGRPDLTAPASELEEKLAALRRQIEENSEYVGMNFAAEARRMHAGEAPGRAIHGEARPDEARALIEEGLPVTPLPFLPARKVN